MICQCLPWHLSFISSFFFFVFFSFSPQPPPFSNSPWWQLMQPPAHPPALRTILSSQDEISVKSFHEVISQITPIPRGSIPRGSCCEHPCLNSDLRDASWSSPVTPQILWTLTPTSIQILPQHLCQESPCWLPNAMTSLPTPLPVTYHFIAVPPIWAVPPNFPFRKLKLSWYSYPPTLFNTSVNLCFLFLVFGPHWVALSHNSWFCAQKLV